MSEENRDTTPLVTPKAVAAPTPVDPFPRKRHYADGFVFNMPIHYYADRKEETVKQSLLDAGNSEDQTEKDMSLIREALAFHDTDFKKEESSQKAR